MRSPVAQPSGSVEVIVELSAPPAGRSLSQRDRARALRSIRLGQGRFEASLARALPSARVRWRYMHVLDGLALVVPADRVGELSAIDGVVGVYPSVRYRALPTRSGGARSVLPDLVRAFGDGGRGIKIGIIDDGIDPDHVYFDPSGFTAPNGFPKGDATFTTAKIIVARAFPPPGADWKYADRPFDPVSSFHGTHVAGIAAGDASTRVPGSLAAVISGVAPLAYLGNYKALTVPTASGLGLNGNSPELVAAIEAAVVDGMDVINLSIGEPEIDPERDAVAKALDNAAAAGVVPVVAAGNDFEELGRGSVASPGSSARAITVGAVSTEGAEPVIASFSASGPTPLGLLPKPDVSAPGVAVLSSVPGDEFVELSGTSMATPYVAGVAALLRAAHPDWTVEELKSALVLTGGPVWKDPNQRTEASSARQGGGLVDPEEAAAPEIFTRPQSIAFGLVALDGGTASVTRSVELLDAGTGGGTWGVTIIDRGPPRGVTLAGPAKVAVPGMLAVTLQVEGRAVEAEHTGFVVLRQDGVERRLPFWFRVTRPRLPLADARPIIRTGTYRDSTLGRPSTVERYRYPDAPPSTATFLRGPERVFLVTLSHPAANIGVAVIAAGRGVKVEPRIVMGADENRLAGATALPRVTNPYLSRFGQRVASSAAILPTAGSYSIVVDTVSPKSAGPFTIRVWIDDVTPPSVEIVSRVIRNGRAIARVSDKGSGVDPEGIAFRVDGGAERSGRLVGGKVVLPLRGVRPGNHRLTLVVSDRQEAKNTENVPQILPNTRVVETTVRIARSAVARRAAAEQAAKARARSAVARRAAAEQAAKAHQRAEGR